MKPVDQNILSDKAAGVRGNCLQAAVASILNLDLDDVPNFNDAPPDVGFWGLLALFLRRRGLFTWEMHGPGIFHPDCFYLAYGKSPRGAGMTHAVVYRNGELVHDPHPSRAGLDGEPTTIALLIPIDPAQVRAGITISSPFFHDWYNAKLDNLVKMIRRS